jgi:hypothetical protein
MGVGGQRHPPVVFCRGKRPGTHCTGGFVGPRTGLKASGLKKIPYARRVLKPELHNIALISVYHTHTHKYIYIYIYIYICVCLGIKPSNYRYPTH